MAVQDGAGWVLNADDAYYYRGEIPLHRTRRTPGLRFYQTIVEVDQPLRMASQRRRRELKRAHWNEVTIFCSHDQQEPAALQARG